MAAGMLLDDGRTEVKVITEGVLCNDEGTIMLNLMASDAGAFMFSRTVPEGADVEAEQAEVWALAEQRAADAGIVVFDGLDPTWSVGPVDDGTRICLVWPGQLSL